MRTAALTVLAVAIATLCAPSGARADKTKDTLDAISTFADQMCVPVAQSGHTTQMAAKGDVKAGLSWLARRLADLGVTGAGEITSTEYAGVLQNELAASLGNVRRCKLEIFDNLQKKLLSSGSDDSSDALVAQLRVAQQRMEMSISQCHADVDAIRTDIGGDGSAYSYAATLDQVDPDTLAYLRSGQGQALVDEFIQLRTHSGKAQGEYGAMAGGVRGLRGILGPQLEQRDSMRKNYYPPTVAQAIEGPIRREQAQIADALAKERPLGNDILATYSRACDILANLNMLMRDRVSALAQGN